MLIYVLSRIREIFAPNFKYLNVWKCTLDTRANFNVIVKMISDDYGLRTS